MAFSWRCLISGSRRTALRFQTSTALVLRDGVVGAEPRRFSPPYPSSFTGQLPAFRSLLHSRGIGLVAPLSPFFHPSPRFYSSSAESSSEVGFIKDVTGVLADNGADAAASAAAAATEVPAQIVGEVAAAAADSFFPVAALQHVIDAVHSVTGLNWWAAIALTTVLIRGATIPLLINQMKATVKLNLLRPEMEVLKQKMENSTDPESLLEGRKQMTELFRKHGVTPFTPLKGMLIQGPVFISFYFAISNMVEKVPSFKGGGVFWFTDLTTPDLVYALPILTGLSFWINVELNTQEGMEGNPMLSMVKNFSRVMALLTVPFTSHFPKAIFCYWITSNIFSLGYGLVLKRPAVKKYLNIPDVPPPSPSMQQSLPFFGRSKLFQRALSGLPVDQSEQAKSYDGQAASSLISQNMRKLEDNAKRRMRSKRR